MRVLLTYIKYSKKCGINNYAALRNAETRNPGGTSQAIPNCLPRWTGVIELMMNEATLSPAGIFGNYA